MLLRLGVEHLHGCLVCTCLRLGVRPALLCMARRLMHCLNKTAPWNPNLPAELKQCLFEMFSQFGRVLDVVCLKTLRLRGQAWVVFTDAASATNALRTMQGFPFFEKPMVRVLGSLPTVLSGVVAAASTGRAPT